MKDRDFATAYLKAIEKKHKAYFASSKLSIMNCVEIEGNSPACVRVTNDSLPPAIRYDIEVMFWRTSVIPTIAKHPARRAS
jgi:hypothetical protein